jgi:UDP-N-acetylglucosamine 1-carboxyvinyltransferase
MESFRIEGGVPLSGTVRVDGAKNAALPACIAVLLTDEPVVLHRVPQLRDVSTILYTLGALGRRVVRHGDHVSIAAGEGLSAEADAYSVRQMRASFLVLAPLLARLGRAVVPLPGGCAIGRRPIDLHLDGLRALGARVEERDGAVLVTADRLIGARIALPYPSVGATEQILMAASLASGETVIENGAIEPEVEDLACLLRKMGAEIEIDNRTIRVDGRKELGGAEYTLIPDRMEAGTFLLAGAITGGSVTVEGVRSDHLTPFLHPLESTGADLTIEAEAVTVHGPTRPLPAEVVAAPHPGFPTDLHPPFVAYLALAAGSSSLVESVFEGRFAYVDALCEMGAQIVRAGTTLTITGVESLQGQTVAATDIRAGAALVLAGLAAHGYTTVTQLEHIDRGYSSFGEKLRSLGARIERRDG